MIRRLIAIAVLGVTVSGCFMAPIAFIGPVTSGFSTASIIQTGVSTGANYMVKKSTGKTISEHAMEALNKDILEQAYLPQEKEKLKKIYLPKNKFSAQCKRYDFYCKRMINKDPSMRSTLLNNEVKIGCKKYDFYCKRMSKKKFLLNIHQDRSLLGSS